MSTNADGTLPSDFLSLPRSDHDTGARVRALLALSLRARAAPSTRQPTRTWIRSSTRPATARPTRRRRRPTRSTAPLRAASPSIGCRPSRSARGERRLRDRGRAGHGGTPRPAGRPEPRMGVDRYGQGCKRKAASLAAGTYTCELEGQGLQAACAAGRRAYRMPTRRCYGTAKADARAPGSRPSPDRCASGAVEGGSTDETFVAHSAPASRRRAARRRSGLGGPA